MRRTQEQRELITTVEKVLTARFPGVELVDLRLHGGADRVLTLFIDRPGGVDLELCAAVTHALDELRERYALEVSSPGLDRPLTKPEHFERALDSTIALRTEAPVGGRSNYRGRLAAASPSGVRVALEEGGLIDLDYDDIARAHVVHTFGTDGGRHE